jgi:hypothetical protein
LTAKADSATQVTLSWTDNSVVETGYTITRNDGVTLTTVSLPANVGGGTVTYVDKTAVANTAYTYVVNATGTPADGATASVSVTTPADASVPLTPPSNVMVQMTGANAESLSFTDLAMGETKYVVQVSNDSGKSWGDGTNTTLTQTVPAYLYQTTGVRAPGAGGAVTLDIANGANLTLTSGRTPYLFRVAAATDTAVGAWGNIATIDLSGLTIIAPASNVTVAQVAGTTPSANLTWVDNANNNASYLLQYTTNAGTSWTNVGTGNNGVRTTSASLGGASTGATVSGMTAGRTYQFRVQAVSLGTNASAFTVSNSLTPIAPPAAPSSITSSLVTTAGLTLNWAANGATSYTVEMATNSAFTSGLVTTPGLTTNTLAVINLNPNTQYYFRVTALNTAGSATSNPVNYTTLDFAPAVPGTPSVSPGTVTSSGLTLTWAAPVAVAGTSGAATSYTVQRGASATGPWTTALGTVNGTSMAVTNLAANTTYWFRVSANNNGGVSSSAYVVSTTSQKTLVAGPTGTPTVSRGTAGAPIDATLSWNTVTGATSYNVQWATSQAALNANTGTVLTNFARGGIFTPTGLTSGTTVYIKVQWVNGTTVSDWGSVGNGTVR